MADYSSYYQCTSCGCKLDKDNNNEEIDDD